MEQKYMKSEELKKQFQDDLESIYEIEIESLVADVKINKVLNPVLLSSDGKLLDGYRRVMAAIKCGVKEIPYLQTNLDATAENRVTLNQHRKKTWMDDRSDLMISFETFGSKQGQKTKSGYDRYEEIVKRTRCKYKDPKSLRQVEAILNKDVKGYPFAYWMLARKSDLKSIERIMEEMEKGEHPEIIEQVVMRELSPKTAVKKIEERVQNRKLESVAFKLPASNSENILIHSGNEEEVMKILESDKAKMFYFEPETCTSTFDDSYDSKRDKNHLVSVYALRLANKIKPYVDSLMDDEGSFFIAVKEFYFNGIARQLPSEVVRNVEKETGLIYKQTLFCTSGDSLVKVQKGNQLKDSITHLLWFVKSADMKLVGSAFPSQMADKVGDNAPLLYRQCSNYIDSQRIPDVIVNHRDKDAIVDAAAIIPIFMCTKEEDLVVDLSMKGELSIAATIMNRRFIGVVQDSNKMSAAAKNLAEAVKSFDKDYASLMSTNVVEEIAA
jgi:hypothetical protein